ncbi:hypothetical protein VTN49DRAFT_8050 [Thermomyces lanuginosus]|uniref:uncharacterized protein n=1 Tax=Thermomyces lanuginosus TaxID=5541 RepID=UPI003743FFBE
MLSACSSDSSSTTFLWPKKDPEEQCHEDFVCIEIASLLEQLFLAGSGHNGNCTTSLRPKAEATWRDHSGHLVRWY